MGARQSSKGSMEEAFSLRLVSELSYRGIATVLWVCFRQVGKEGGSRYIVCTVDNLQDVLQPPVGPKKHFFQEALLFFFFTCNHTQQTCTPTHIDTCLTKLAFTWYLLHSPSSMRSFFFSDRKVLKEVLLDQQATATPSHGHSPCFYDELSNLESPPRSSKGMDDFSTLAKVEMQGMPWLNSLSKARQCEALQRVDSFMSSVSCLCDDDEAAASPDMPIFPESPSDEADQMIKLYDNDEMANTPVSETSSTCTVISVDSVDDFTPAPTPVDEKGVAAPAAAISKSTDRANTADSGKGCVTRSKTQPKRKKGVGTKTKMLLGVDWAKVMEARFSLVEDEDLLGMFLPDMWQQHIHDMVSSNVCMDTSTWSLSKLYLKYIRAIHIAGFFCVRMSTPYIYEIASLEFTCEVLRIYFHNCVSNELIYFLSLWLFLAAPPLPVQRWRNFDVDA